ncbi:Yip1 family protein [Sphingomonas sp.]|uniref:Yip1 family protein n=1 Tax=Sphingomonas sp. TaxID=28214 RepID=UPI003CC6C3D3
MASQFPGDRPPPYQPGPGGPLPYQPGPAGQPPYGSGPGGPPPQGPGGGGMVGRIQRLITRPAAEWPAIDADPSPAMATFTKVAVPLAAIGPIANLLKGQLFGWGAFGVSFRPSLVWSIANAVKDYAVALIGVWIFALVIEALAPTFQAWKSRDQAMKVVCWSFVAAWLAQGFVIIPYLGVLLSLAGLYSLYVLWVGMPPMMRTPPDKAVPYVILSVVVGAIGTAIAAVVLGLVVGILAPSPLAFGTGGTVTLGSLNTGNGASINLDQLAAAGQQMAASADRAAANANTATTNGTVSNGHIVDPAALQAMLPTSVAGFTRTAVESSGGSAAGLGAATAKGTYTLGDQSFELSVSDVGALGSLATLGGALNVNSNRQTATGYERTSMQNGSMVDEEWDGSEHHGKFTTMVASRFAVAAEGNAPSIDPLKAAVATIDTGRLAALAH